MSKSSVRSPQSSQVHTRSVVAWGLFCALAYLCVMLIRIPVVQFLKYEPKDVILMIGAFIYGPLPGLFMTVVVSLVEMVTISDTGWIGALMNILSSGAFVCTAAAIYRRRHTLKGAIVGLAVGSVTMVAVMMIWNALITPLYMGVPRAAVLDMLLPVFLPFNLLKAVLNSALVMLLYKRVVTALRYARLLPPTASGTAKPATRSTVAVVLVSMVLIATAVLVILALQGIL